MKTINDKIEELNNFFNKVKERDQNLMLDFINKILEKKNKKR